MALGPVRLAAAAVGAGGVEVAQGGEAQAVDAVIPLQRLFDHQLGLSVDVGRAEWRVFGERLVAGLVDGGRRRQDEARHAGTLHGVQQSQRELQVVVEVLGGVRHALAGLDEGGEVHDGVESARLQHALERGAVAEIGLDEGDAWPGWRAAWPVTSESKIVTV